MGYAAVSAVALLADMATLAALVQWCSWWYLAAASAAFLTGMTLAYVLSVRFVFKRHRLRSRRAEFAGFAALGAAGLVVNAAVMFIAVRFAGLHYLVAKIVAAGCTFLCNFVSRRQLLFVPRSSR
jgi:putative flippase GtrA